MKKLLAAVCAGIALVSLGACARLDERAATLPPQSERQRQALAEANGMVTFENKAYFTMDGDLYRLDEKDKLTCLQERFQLITVLDGMLYGLFVREGYDGAIYTELAVFHPDGAGPSSLYAMNMYEGHYYDEETGTVYLCTREVTARESQDGVDEGFDAFPDYDSGRQTHAVIAYTLTTGATARAAILYGGWNYQLTATGIYYTTEVAIYHTEYFGNTYVVYEDLNPPQDFTVVNGAIYYSDYDAFYTIDTDSGEQQRLAELNDYETPVYDGEWVYLSGCRVNLDSGEKEDIPLPEGRYWFAAYDYVYYQKQDDFATLYFYDVTGGHTGKIRGKKDIFTDTVGAGKTVMIKDGYLYFVRVDIDYGYRNEFAGEFELYKIKLGTNAAERIKTE